MNVLFEDNEIIVLVKPVGIPSEDTPNGEKGIIYLLKNQQGLSDVFLLHRLDRNVSGIMLMAKSGSFAGKFSALVSERAVDKEYLAINYPKVIKVLDSFRRDYEKDGLLCNLDKRCVVEWPKNFQDNYDVDVVEGKICEEPHVSIKDLILVYNGDNQGKENVRACIPVWSDR